MMSRFWTKSTLVGRQLNTPRVFWSFIFFSIFFYNSFFFSFLYIFFFISNFYFSCIFILLLLLQCFIYSYYIIQSSLRFIFFLDFIFLLIFLQGHVLWFLWLITAVNEVIVRYKISLLHWESHLSCIFFPWILLQNWSCD